MNITKYAIKEEDLPSANVLATYVESLNLYALDNTGADQTIIKAIKSLPPPHIIKNDFSKSECRVIFETIGWLWKEITGKKLINEEKIQKAPETLKGNYWMLSNGLLLPGVNHYSIIKKNANLISSLLKINGMVLQQYLGKNPKDLIGLVIRHGGVRIFVNTDRNAYFQMNQDIYAEWGRKKVKGYDFKKKIVKVIDLTAPYKGWDSGISVKL